MIDIQAHPEFGSKPAAGTAGGSSAPRRRRVGR